MHTPHTHKYKVNMNRLTMLASLCNGVEGKQQQQNKQTNNNKNYRHTHTTGGKKRHWEIIFWSQSVIA